MPILSCQTVNSSKSLQVGGSLCQLSESTHVAGFTVGRPRGSNCPEIKPAGIKREKIPYLKRYPEEQMTDSMLRAVTHLHNKRPLPAPEICLLASY